MKNKEKRMILILLVILIIAIVIFVVSKNLNKESKTKEKRRFFFDGSLNCDFPRGSLRYVVSCGEQLVELDAHVAGSRGISRSG